MRLSGLKGLGFSFWYLGLRPKPETLFPPKGGTLNTRNTRNPSDIYP